MQQHTKHQCENRDVQCEFCGMFVAWRNMENHRREACPEAVISCPHAALSGCVAMLKRKDMEIHAKDATLHLEKAFGQIKVYPLLDNADF